MRDTFLKRVVEIAENDPKILLVTGDLGFKVLDEFREKYPAQYLNAGIAEQNMAGMGAGLALEGWTVLLYSIANFPSLRCFEQIRNDIVYHNANVKVISIGSGFSYGQLGMSHHGTEDITIMRTLPGMTILSPCNDWEMTRCTEFLLSEKGPFYLRVDKSGALTAPINSGEIFSPGKLRLLRDGTDVSIISTGSIISEAMKAAEELATAGISVRVYSCHSLKPFDVDTLRQAASETAGLITLEEHTIDGGLGGIVAEILLEGEVRPGFFKRMGLPSMFAKVVGCQEYLRKEYKLDAMSVVEQVQELFIARAPRGHKIKGVQ